MCCSSGGWSIYRLETDFQTDEIDKNIFLLFIKPDQEPLLVEILISTNRANPSTSRHHHSRPASPSVRTAEDRQVRCMWGKVHSDANASDQKGILSPERIQVSKRRDFASGSGEESPLFIHFPISKDYVNRVGSCIGKELTTSGKSTAIFPP